LSDSWSPKVGNHSGCKGIDTENNEATTKTESLKSSAAVTASVTNPEQELEIVNISGFVTRSDQMEFVPLIFLLLSQAICDVACLIARAAIPYSK